MIKPIGRSYNHHDWEQYSGHFSNILFSCDEEEPACFVNLPKPEEGYNYILTSYDHSLPEKDVAARFLEKTTFGPRRSEIASFTSPLEWIQKQMSLPATSHRAFFRERATNWHFEATHAGLLHTGPCNKGARFRRFAFANPDKARIVTVSNVTNDGSKRIVSIDGEIRTIARSVQIGVHSFPMDELPGGE